MKKSEQYRLLRDKAEKLFYREHYLLAKQKYLECLLLTRPGTQKHKFTLELIEEMNWYIDNNKLNLRINKAIQELNLKETLNDIVNELD